MSHFATSQVYVVILTITSTMWSMQAQRGWPQDLFPVHMYALTLEPRADGDHGAGVQTRSRKKVRNAPAVIVD